jgi:hypothetical protein
MSFIIREASQQRNLIESENEDEADEDRITSAQSRKRRRISDDIGESDEETPSEVELNRGFINDEELSDDDESGYRWVFGEYTLGFLTFCEYSFSHLRVLLENGTQQPDEPASQPDEPASQPDEPASQPDEEPEQPDTIGVYYSRNIQ